VGSGAGTKVCGAGPLSGDIHPLAPDPDGSSLRGGLVIIKLGLTAVINTVHKLGQHFSCYFLGMLRPGIRPFDVWYAAKCRI
jgi:hypothetical protein